MEKIQKLISFSNYDGMEKISDRSNKAYRIIIQDFELKTNLKIVTASLLYKIKDPKMLREYIQFINNKQSFFRNIRKCINLVDQKFSETEFKKILTTDLVVRNIDKILQIQEFLDEETNLEDIPNHLIKELPHIIKSTRKFERINKLALNISKIFFIPNENPQLIYKYDRNGTNIDIVDFYGEGVDIESSRKNLEFMYLNLKTLREFYLSNSEICVILDTKNNYDSNFDTFIPKIIENLVRDFNICLFKFTDDQIFPKKIESLDNEYRFDGYLITKEYATKFISKYENPLILMDNVPTGREWILNSDGYIL